MTDPVNVTCHCGAVALRVTLSQGLETARRCDCSYCRRRGAPMLSARLADLEVVRGKDALSLYQFGTGVAAHYFCGTCGIYMYHRRRSDPSEYGINMGAIEGVNPAEHEPIAWNDGLNHPADR
ncbi:Glutathione-dependent formaldehyde-activating enzyme [Roseivivax lentus]|uniref:Glutathione-dependent formaldehyde-activating enzyme n=1 Tax=Roseivivax lentus TaxID=633194 RepID=A0A1N7PPK6_9RHOB|nr:GFA family protein [Roseivivax lentus]SIT12551.1 Glutathione-dependent formaldehyde-activating enzyme [Roseivivax lentus]